MINGIATSSHDYKGLGGRGHNPYRTGVLIGNYFEDNFGKELINKYSTVSNFNFVPKKRIPNDKYLSETTDKFRWPEIKSTKNYGPSLQHPGSTGQNFNFNIDFRKKYIKDYMDTLKNIEPIYSNKYPLIPERLENEKNSELLMSGASKVTDETNLGHKKRSVTCDHEVRSNILFGHGCQKKFETNDLNTFYHLTLDKKIRTKTLLDSHWGPPEPFKKQPNPMADHTDWGFRNYKVYGRFTKKFDKKKM